MSCKIKINSVQVCYLPLANLYCTTKRCWSDACCQPLTTYVCFMLFLLYFYTLVTRKLFADCARTICVMIRSGFADVAGTMLSLQLSESAFPNIVMSIKHHMTQRFTILPTKSSSYVDHYIALHLNIFWQVKNFAAPKKRSNDITMDMLMT